jgi:SAM-dependent methyltransferase
MKSIPSLLRLEEHKALAAINLNGSVLDIGGDRRAEYQALIKGTHTLTVVNLDEKSKPDIFHDLEKPLPVQDNQFDHVLLINVLEHIFNYRELLKESIRAIKFGGTVVVIVPFLFPIHPSPNDFHRFTEQTLRKELELLNLKNIQITALGTGVFGARYLMKDRLLPAPIRFIRYYTARYFVYLYDWLFVKISKILKKKYIPSDYALGYCVTAQK